MIQLCNPGQLGLEAWYFRPDFEDVASARWRLESSMALRFIHASIVDQHGFASTKYARANMCLITLL